MYASAWYDAISFRLCYVTLRLLFCSSDNQRFREVDLHDEEKGTKRKNIGITTQLEGPQEVGKFGEIGDSDEIRARLLTE